MRYDMITPTPIDADLTVAREIRRQIGHRAFQMLGARDFTGEQNSFAFKIGHNDKHVNHVRIILNPKDYYDIEFWGYQESGTEATFQVLSSESDVCVDNLHETIEEHTGMRTSL